MKTLPNRACQIHVSCEYTDPVTFLEYEFSATVIISREYEVEVVNFLSIDVYDANEPLNEDVAYILASAQPINEQLRKIAGDKALEKVQIADFDAESERE